MTDPEGGEIVQRMIAEDPLGARVTVATNAEGRAVIRAFEPALAPAG
jgi:hypothetical protein